MTTFDITKSFLIYTIENSFQGHSEKKNDSGKTITKFKFDNSANLKLDQFFQKLPALSSCHSSGPPNKKYLPAEFVNIFKLYSFYKEYCKINGDVPVSKYLFRNSFEKQYNLGFHVTKKDKCHLCVTFVKTICSSSEQEIQKSHLDDINECKAMIVSQKQIIDLSCVSASFDLQNVLSTPIGYNKNINYSRKFSMSNLTVFENITQNAFCYLWGETTGNRSSNEIVSCIYDYLIKVDQRKSVTSVVLTCNSVTRRNKNKAMLMMMYHALQYELHSITKIKLIFLPPGHTCIMPVDSFIVTIDRFIKNKTVLAPSEWPTIIRNARTYPMPLEIIEMKTSDFFDWTLFSNQFKTGRDVTILNSKLKSVSFQKEENNVKLLVYNSYKNICPEKLVILKNKKEYLQTSNLICYTENKCISNAKFNDLIKLCNDGIIPEK